MLRRGRIAVSHLTVALGAAGDRVMAPSSAAHPLRRPLAAGAAVIALAAVGLALWPSRAAPGEGHARRLQKWSAALHGPAGAGVRMALAKNDRVSAYALARASCSEDAPDAAACLVRADLGVALREPLEALDCLERALRGSPGVVTDEVFITGAVQTFGASRPSRTQALLAQVPKDRLVPVLNEASADWSYRVRHGALDQLKALGAPTPDEVGVMLLDLWQVDRCDARRSLARKLQATADARVAPVLELLAQRDDCLEGVVQAASRKER